MKMDFTAEKINEYESLIKSRLSEYRYNHSMNVAKSAVYLAEKYGADCEKAYVAGVLHDIMKEESLEIQQQFIESDGYKMTGTELAVPSVYHQMSGAAYCKKVLGIDDDEIIGAIRFHTTGKADMTLLEKVVYTADFISAERNYPDVDIMRRLADENLEIVNKKVGEIPFSLENPPIAINANMQQINWGLKFPYRSVARKTPKSTTPISRVQEIELYPYGCCKLRMTEMPILK